MPLRLSRRFAHFFVSRTRFFGKMHPGDADWLVSCKLDRTREYYVRAASSLTSQNQIAAARTLHVPTLIVHGTNDHVLPYRAGVELAEAIPGARLVTLQDAGHAIFFTHCEAVNAAIAEFLENLRSSRVAAAPASGT
jgi:pimeloyl-ACP methyl ester carboxylesterase